jgi:hypothetical protein
MSRLLGAMKLKINEIVLVEKRPFSFADFNEIEVGGQEYHMNDGTRPCQDDTRERVGSNQSCV